MKSSLTVITSVLLAASSVLFVGAQSAASPLTNADVIRFVQMRLPEQAVINLISEAQAARLGQFDLSPSGVSDLAAHGVSPSVIAAMHPPSTPTTTPTRTPPVATLGKTQTSQSAQKPASIYDTPAQIEAKKKALAFWCIEEGHSSKESPCNSRKEYALKVLEIIKRTPPHTITLEMYKQLVTDDQNGNFLADGWATFLSLPEEVSRTSIDGTEVVMYQWKNPDGSNVLGTYRDGHLVSKAQSGLK